MPTAFTHAFVGASLASFAPPGPRRRTFLVLAGLLAAAPDLDVLAFSLGVPYAHPLGHRGFSHSILFAALLGALAAACLRPGGVAGLGLPAAVLGLSIASHGLLDAFTDAGLGVGLFIPFSDQRLFFPWRPLATSPLSPAAFFRGSALPILLNELLWIWLPVGTVLIARRIWPPRARSG